MQKYADIIMFPADNPEIRFQKLLKLIEDICSQYPNGFLSFCDDRFVTKDNIASYYAPHYGGSIIKISSGNHIEDDKYISKWTKDYYDKRIIQYIFRRINIVLNPMQRELLLNRYMKYLTDSPLSRDDLIIKYSLSRKKYDSQMREIKEILYEVLDLDVVDDYGKWMSLSFVQYLREIRTGIEKGYIGLHPEWENI